ncbi:MAG: hypothetical protein KBC73_13215 [Burkholderiaceae bacterium]|nr:hypothetical protein [Burkholderiaceae bacterium]
MLVITAGPGSARVDCRDGVLKIAYRGLLTAGVLSRITQRVSLEVRSQSGALSGQLIGAFVADFRGAALACTASEIEQACGGILLHHPGIFVAAGVAHDALRICALRMEFDNLHRRVCSHYGASLDAALRYVREGTAVKVEHAR